MARQCSACGAPMGDTAAFCNNCGAKCLIAGQPQASPAYAPPPVQAPPPTPQPYAPPAPPPAQAPSPAPQPYSPPYAPPPAQPYYAPLQQPQFTAAPAAPLQKKSMKMPIIGGAAGLCLIALIVAAIATNGFGLFGNSGSGSLGSLDVPGRSRDTTGPGSSEGNDGEPGAAEFDYSTFGDPDPIKDPISAKALAGSWSFIWMGFENKGVQWVFGDNGTFACFVVVNLGSSYLDSYGYSYYRSNAAYKHLMQGHYEVSGGKIEFTGCMISTAMTFDTEYWRDDGINDAASKLLFAPLEEPEIADDFTADFEFIDATRLRLRLDRGLIDVYDWDFVRDGEPVSSPLPEHRIPPDAWPSGMLSPDMPVFTGGRIREAKAATSEGVAPEYQNISITVDRSSWEAALEYAAELRRLGWSGPSAEELADIDNYYGSYRSSFQYRKGCYDISIGIDHDGNSANKDNERAVDRIGIYAYRNHEGVWPSDILGDDFRPPANVVLIGEREASGWGSRDISYGGEMDFYPMSPEDYFAMLEADGFLTPRRGPDSFVEYAVYKFLRINGDMYKVTVKRNADWGMSKSNIGTIAEFWYNLELFPDFDWGPDIPSVFDPPPGLELFRDEDGDRREFMYGETYGSAQFCVMYATEEEIREYFKGLEQSGWSLNEDLDADSGIWRYSCNIIIPYEGLNWRCIVESGRGFLKYTEDNLRHFEIRMETDWYLN